MNMQALMQQAQKMQRDITKKKDEINNYNSLQETIQKQNDEITSLKEQNYSLRTTITEKDHLITELNSQIEGFKNGIQELRTKIQTLQTDPSSSQQSTSQNYVPLDQYKQLKFEIQILENEIQQKNQELNELSIRYETLKNDHKVLWCQLHRK